MERKRRQSTKLVGVFFLALVLFNYPIMSLFNTGLSVMGVPLFYICLFMGWTLIILFILLITETGNKLKKNSAR